MTSEEKELLHRHLNGDLDAGEHAAFLTRLQSSAELRRELASHALDETLLSELVLEGRPVAKAPARRRAWIPASIAAAMLIGLTLLLFRGTPKIDPEPPKTPAEAARRPERAGVADAVRRGCEYLESRRLDIVTPITREKRHGTASRRTYAELALLALHRGGVPDSHPFKAELLGLVNGRSVEAGYIAGYQAMALAEIDPVAYQERLRYCAQLLVDSQCANGQWDYTVKLAVPDVPPTGRIRRRAEGPPSGDNSVTAIAVLGLRACVRAGVDVDPDVIARARAWWLRCQNLDGGWGYNDATDPLANDVGRKSYTTNSSYGSATAGGVASLAALREMREDDGRSDGAIKRGLEWLGANFTADRTPGKDPGLLPVHWLVMAGRAGQLLALERFGAHDWYTEGADFLLQAQRPTGQWAVESSEFLAPEKNDVLDTCLAILFLRRAP